jgi:hypothetical protein
MSGLATLVRALRLARWRNAGRALDLHPVYKRI